MPDHPDILEMSSKVDTLYWDVRHLQDDRDRLSARVAALEETIERLHAAFPAEQQPSSGERRISKRTASPKTISADGGSTLEAVRTGIGQPGTNEKGHVS